MRNNPAITHGAFGMLVKPLVIKELVGLISTMLDSAQ